MTNPALLLFDTVIPAWVTTEVTESSPMRGVDDKPVGSPSLYKVVQI